MIPDASLFDKNDHGEDGLFMEEAILRARQMVVARNERCN